MNSVRTIVIYPKMFIKIHHGLDRYTARSFSKYDIKRQVRYNAIESKAKKSGYLFFKIVFLSKNPRSHNHLMR